MVPCGGKGLATDKIVGTTGACYTLGGGKDGWMPCTMYIPLCVQRMLFLLVWTLLMFKGDGKMRLFLSNPTDESQNRKTREGRTHTYTLKLHQK